MRDLSKTNSISGISHLIEILRDQVGQITNYENLARTVGVSAPTIKNWLNLLERLYLIFKVPPYTGKISRSLKKESKYYFYDCAASYGHDVSRLENLVACSLLKYCHYLRDTQGKDYKLFFFRDKDGHEVDFVITYRSQVLYAIEVKTSGDQFSKSLFYFKKKTNSEQTVQLVLNATKELEKDGVILTSLSDWLYKLYDYTKK